MVRKRFLNLHYGNKGFIFTLDALFGSILIVSLMLVSFYLVSSDKAIENSRLGNLGSDIVTMLDYNGSFNMLNNGTIEKDMDLLLPYAYDMNILLVTKNNGNYSIGRRVAGEIVGSGKRIILIRDDREIVDFGLANYNVWVR